MRGFLFFLFFSFSVLVSAQITASESVLNFGEVFKGEPSTKAIQIQNAFNQDVECTLTFSNPDFKSSSNFTIKAGSTYKVDVVFDPVHNVLYDAELLINTNSRSGALAVDLKGQGNYKESYYASTKNLWEEDLKSALKSTISANYVNLGYNGARDKMYGEIDNVNGKVTCVYTGREATFNTRDGANNNSFNCEHTWPQSLFNSNEPEKADIHHLFPTDVDANSKRSNYAFKVVGSATWTEGGSKLGGGYFEPRDAQKGETARAMLYFGTRYTNYSSFLTAQEATLRNWAKTFPPTAASESRNEKIFSYQKNRNPYVDHPEFLDRINSISLTSVAPVKFSYLLSTRTVNMQSYPQTSGLVYGVVVVNNGNRNIVFDKIENSKPEFIVSPDSFTLKPGASLTLQIELRGIKEFGKISDTLFLNQTGRSTQDKVVLQGEITSLSDVKDLDADKYIDIRQERIILTNAIGFRMGIYTLDGKLCALNEITSDFTEIKLNELATGVYFVTLTNEFGVKTVKKFTVSH